MTADDALLAPKWTKWIDLVTCTSCHYLVKWDTFDKLRRSLEEATAQPSQPSSFNVTGDWFINHKRGEA